MATLLKRLYLQDYASDLHAVFTEWCVFRDQAAIHITQVNGGVHLHIRICARADVLPFPYLETAGWIVLKFVKWLEAY